MFATILLISFITKGIDAVYVLGNPPIIKTNGVFGFPHLAAPNCSDMILNATYDMVFLVDMTTNTAARDAQSILTNLIAGTAGLINAFQPNGNNGRFGIMLVGSDPAHVIFFPLDFCTSVTDCNELLTSLAANPFKQDPPEPSFDDALLYGILNSIINPAGSGWRPNAQGHIIVVVATKPFAAAQWATIQSAATGIKATPKTTLMGVAIGGDTTLMSQMNTIATRGRVLSVPSGSTAYPTVVQAVVSDACSRL